VHNALADGRSPASFCRAQVQSGGLLVGFCGGQRGHWRDGEEVVECLVI